jgi:hypothetical protein
MYTLGPPIVVNPGSSPAISPGIAQGNATRVVNVGTATALSVATASYTAGAPISVSAPTALGVGIAAATTTRIVPTVGAALGVGVTKAPIAPLLLTSPLQLVARETGTSNYYDVTYPTKPRINRTEDFDAFGADLGFSWDGGNGQTFIAFGDTFGSDWIGPFGGLQAGGTTTVAAASASQNVASVTEIYVGNASLLSDPSNKTEGYRNVTTALSNGSYATFRYTGRDTVNNKITGVTLVTGSGNLLVGASISNDDIRSGGGWRSQTLAISTDTDLTAGYTIDGFVTTTGYSTTSGTAIELVTAKHSSDVTSSRYSTSTSLAISTVGQIYGVTVITTATPHGLNRAGQMVYLTGITGTLSSMNNQDWPVYQVYDATTFFILTLGADVANRTNGTVKVAANPNPSATTSNPEVTLVPTGGVAVPRAASSGGYRQYMFLMSVNHWGDNGGNLVNHCVLAYSDDNGVNWTKASWRWDNDATFTSKITQIWPVRRNGYVYGFCGGIYRYDPPVLIRCLETDLLTQASWEYWDGSTWVANSPSSVTFLWETGLTGGMGEPAVYWNEGNQCWVSTYLNDRNWIDGTGIELRSASTLMGPWSTPQNIHDGAYWEPDQGIYGGFIHPLSGVAPPDTTDLYFHVSLFSPYSTYLMKAALGVPLKAPGAAIGVARAGTTITVVVPGATATSPAVARADSVRIVVAGPAAATEVGIATTVALGVKQVHLTTATLVGTGALDAVGAITALTVATSTGVDFGTVNAVAIVVPRDGVVLRATSSLTASVTITATSTASCAGTSSSTIVGYATLRTASTLTGTGTVVATTVRVQLGVATLTGTGACTPVGVGVARVSSSLTATSAGTVTARLTVAARATLSAVSTSYVVSARLYEAVVVLAGTGTVTSAVAIRATAVALLVGTSGFPVSIALLRYVTAALAGTGTLTVTTRQVHPIADTLRSTITRKVGTGFFSSAIQGPDGTYVAEAVVKSKKMTSGTMISAPKE